MPPSSPRRVLVVATTTIETDDSHEPICRIAEVLRALKAEGLHTVVMNAPLATMSKWIADADSAYFLPVDLRSMKRAILDERVHIVMLDFGDPVAAGCVRELDESGFLERHGIAVFEGNLRAARPIDSVRLASSDPASERNRRGWWTEEAHV